MKNMIRCENIVALGIGKQMANNEGKTLKLPKRPTSAGSSKELRMKRELFHALRSPSVISHSSWHTQEGQLGNYENGDTDFFNFKVNVRKVKSRNSEGVSNGDIDDLFAERRNVESRTLSRTSTTISEEAVNTRTSSDSEIFSEEEGSPDIHVKHVWNSDDEKSCNESSGKVKVPKEYDIEFDEVFLALDKNKDGIITFKELKDGAQLFGWNPTGNDISRYLTKMDRDGDEEVTKTEFRMYLQDLLSKLEHPVKVLEDSIDVMMRAIDTDGNGLCSKEEFRVFIQERGDSPLTDADVEELFQQFDSDGDKTTLNKSELFRLLTDGMDLLV